MAKDGPTGNALIQAYTDDIVRLHQAEMDQDWVQYRIAREDAKASLAELIDFNMQHGAE